MKVVLLTVVLCLTSAVAFGGWRSPCGPNGCQAFAKSKIKTEVKVETPAVDVKVESKDDTKEVRKERLRIRIRKS